MGNFGKFLGLASSVLVCKRIALIAQRRPILTACWQMQKKMTDNNLVNMVGQPQQQPKTQLQQQMEQQLHQQMEWQQRQMEQPMNQLQTMDLNLEKKMPVLKVDDYLVKFHGSLVELERQFPDKTVKIFFNINNSLPKHLREYVDKVTTHFPVRCAPNFEVFITRGDWTLALSCGYTTTVFNKEQYEEQPDAESRKIDVYEIETMSMLELECNEFDFTSDKHIVEKYVLDALSDLLRGLGITNLFALKMSYLATAYLDAAGEEFIEELIRFGIDVPPRPKRLAPPLLEKTD